MHTRAFLLATGAAATLGPRPGLSRRRQMRRREDRLSHLAASGDKNPGNAILLAVSEPATIGLASISIRSRTPFSAGHFRRAAAR